MPTVIWLLRLCVLKSVVVGTPALVNVVEGVRHPLLLQHTVPLVTQEQRLATTTHKRNQRQHFTQKWIH